ncbi:MAG: hypothetical protein AAGA48_28655 [Myxococcota bacterium]
MLIGYEASRDVKKRMVSLYHMLMEPPEAALRRAVEELDAQGHAIDIEVISKDPNAIIAVISDDFEIEALSGAYLSRDDCLAGRGRDVAWLRRHEAIQDTMPMDLHDRCVQSGSKQNGSSQLEHWIGVALPTAAGGSVLALFRTSMPE